MKPFRVFDVDDFESIVSKRCDKQALSLNVGGQMVNPAFDIGEEDRAE